MEVNKVCRTCLCASEEMISMYETCTTTHLTSADMLMSFVSLKCHENDGLPKLICYNCICVLNRFHTFRLKCVESDEILRNLLTTTENGKQIGGKVDDYVDNQLVLITNEQNEMGTITLNEPLSNHDIQMVMGQTLDIIKHEIDVDVKPEIDVIHNKSTSLVSDNSIIGRKTEQLSCAICNIMFKRTDSLAAHMRQHTGTKPHSCTVCNSSFMRKDRLAIHMRKHAGHKQYMCSVCNSSFSRKDILVVHMRQHIEEKPYSCTVCNKSFVQKDVLIVHMRGHTGEKPYSCTFCDNSFTVKSSLTKHLRKHTGEKPYSCAICSSSFDRKDTFTVHMRKHSGEKPYACTECNRQFTVKTNLTSHMRKHV